MNPHTQTFLIEGPVGAIDIAFDGPAGPPRGVALVAHPHPLYGGTRDNKVVQTITRALLAEGFAVWRPNFRGVGGTVGEHDAGGGETDDLMRVLEHIQADQRVSEPARARLVLAGFSFGSFVQTRVAQRLAQQGRPVSAMVLVGPAAQRFDLAPVPANTLVVHGELDELVPLSAVFDWARPQEIPVVVLPGADHFFHRRLTQLKALVSAFVARAQGAQTAAGESI
jgi:alpha/beta superfamily hydrolase